MFDTAINSFIETLTPDLKFDKDGPILIKDELLDECHIEHGEEGFDFNLRDHNLRNFCFDEKLMAYKHSEEDIITNEEKLLEELEKSEELEHGEKKISMIPTLMTEEEPELVVHKKRRRREYALRHLNRDRTVVVNSILKDQCDIEEVEQSFNFSLDVDDNQLHDFDFEEDFLACQHLEGDLIDDEEHLLQKLESSADKDTLRRLSSLLTPKPKSDKKEIHKESPKKKRKKNQYVSHVDIHRDEYVRKGLQMRMRKENIKKSHKMRTRSSLRANEAKEDKFEHVPTSIKVTSIGIYDLKKRSELVQRYLEKRKKRCWKRTIKYGVRKTFADSRMRVKGRFISKKDEASLRESLLCIV